jgi:uncharacterized Tic20 family protein
MWCYLVGLLWLPFRGVLAVCWAQPPGSLPQVIILSGVFTGLVTYAFVENIPVIGCTAMREATHHRMFSERIGIPFLIWTSLSVIAMVSYVAIVIRGAIAAYNGQHYRYPLISRVGDFS